MNACWKRLSSVSVRWTGRGGFTVCSCSQSPPLSSYRYFDSLCKYHMIQYKTCRYRTTELYSFRKTCNCITVEYCEEVNSNKPTFFLTSLFFSSHHKTLHVPRHFSHCHLSHWHLGPWELLAKFIIAIWFVPAIYYSAYFKTLCSSNAILTSLWCHDTACLGPCLTCLPVWTAYCFENSVSSQ